MQGGANKGEAGASPFHYGCRRFNRMVPRVVSRMMIIRAGVCEVFVRVVRAQPPPEASCASVSGSLPGSLSVTGSF